MKKKKDNFELLEISEKAQEVALLIREKMEDAEIYRPEFNHVVELLAETIYNYNRCLSTVHSSGFSEMTEKGGMKTLPEAGMMLQLGVQIKQLSEQLMLTPKSAGAKNGSRKEKDPLADIIPLAKVK